VHAAPRPEGIGRVAVTVAALPAIFPVNYAVDEGDIYFWTSEGTKLWAAAHNAVVAFEIDTIDPMSHTGWSVMVVGSSSKVTDPTDVKRLGGLPLTPWLRSGSGSLVRIQASLVSGRELTSSTEN
jgi:nitroimidazol reductase NimA-like FMN-containing flavoprotein (pyridoxamine 5'-phosphate oxidase superfamily)